MCGHRCRWRQGLLVVLLGLAGSVLAVPTEQQMLARPQQIPQWLRQGAIPRAEIPNPHWREDACTTCHRGSLEVKQPRRRFRDTEKLCGYCHGDSEGHVHVHPVDVPVSKRLLDSMDKLLRRRLQGDSRRPKLGCTTCHDIRVQCRRKNFPEKSLRHAFLRGGPYRSRTGFCYACHPRKAYARLNSHAQVDGRGKVLHTTCLLCHQKVPRELPDGTVVDADLVVPDEYSQLCLNCHQVLPHPGGDLVFLDKGGPNHLVQPPPGIARYMAKMAERNGIILPLEAGSGKIYCATCHNPHARGVIRNPRAARGADAPKRLRAKSMCDNCHDL